MKEIHPTNIIYGERVMVITEGDVQSVVGPFLHYLEEAGVVRVGPASSNHLACNIRIVDISSIYTLDRG